MQKNEMGIEAWDADQKAWQKEHPELDEEKQEKKRYALPTPEEEEKKGPAPAERCRGGR